MHTKHILDTDTHDHTAPQPPISMLAINRSDRQNFKMEAQRGVIRAWSISSSTLKWGQGAGIIFFATRPVRFSTSNPLQFSLRTDQFVFPRWGISLFPPVHISSPCCRHRFARCRAPPIACSMGAVDAHVRLSICSFFVSDST